MAGNSTNDGGDKAKQRREALDALGSYAKEGQLTPEIKDLLNLIDDESDRGAVVLIGSILEDFLLSRILGKLKPLDHSDVKNLIRTGGLLSAFVDKITLAHAMNLIDDDVVEMLMVIKAMRNACAHSRLNIGFSTPVLREVLFLLFDHNKDDFKDATNPLFLRFIFIVISGFLFMRIKGISHSVANAWVQNLATDANFEAQQALAKVSASQSKRKKRSQKPDLRDRRD